MSNDPANQEKEMSKMIAFIMQEALDKVSELEIRGDEEYEIEKARIVRQETVILEENAEKKKKEFQRQRKIRHAGQKTKINMHVLEVKREIMDEIFIETQNRIQMKIQEDEKFNKNMLKELLIEGIEILGEADVSVMCLVRDHGLVKDICNELCVEKNDSLTLLDSPIPEDSIGGLIVQSSNGKIWCNNTLKKRFGLAKDSAIAEFGKILFKEAPERMIEDIKDCKISNTN
eukprot:GHVP01068497.1.p1 GENE.GHVP01068497.1~~GHVP01068497.1.p1  ORF type:complete len:231 (-),score=62.68 GHVP01068497.1:126-818(-)